MKPAVLFDIDDTLFDHTGCTGDALGVLRTRYPELQAVAPGAMAQEYKRVLEALHLQVLAGAMTIDAARVERFERLFAFAGVSANAQTALDAAVLYRSSYLSAWREVDGARDLLSALRGRAATAIVTNNIAKEQRRKIAACGFEPLVDAVVISEEVGITKPDPRIFEIALERLGCAAGEAVMVGNAWDTDVLGARAAGVRPIWFNRTGAPSPDESVTEIWSLRPTELVVAVILEELALSSLESRAPSPESQPPNPDPRIPTPESRAS